MSTKTAEQIADAMVVPNDNGNGMFNMYLGHQTVYNIEEHHAAHLRNAIIRGIERDRAHWSTETAHTIADEHMAGYGELPPSNVKWAHLHQSLRDVATQAYRAGVAAEQEEAARLPERVVLRSDEGPSPIRTGASTVAEIVAHFNEMVAIGYDPAQITLEGIFS